MPFQKYMRHSTVTLGQNVIGNLFQNPISLSTFSGEKTTPKGVSLLSRGQQINERVLQLSSVGQSAHKRDGKWHFAEDMEIDRQTKVFTVSTDLSRSLVFFLTITLLFLTDVFNYHSCCLHWLQTNNNRISICKYRRQFRIEQVATASYGHWYLRPARLKVASVEVSRAGADASLLVDGWPGFLKQGKEISLRAA